MALPEPDERLSEEDSASAAPPRPNVERPDWLVGADEGAVAEQSRLGGGSPTPREAPRLIKPGEGLQFEGPEPGPAPPVGRPLPAAKPAPAPEPEAPKRPTAWTAAASSIPRLTLAPAASDAQVARRMQRAEEPDEQEAAPEFLGPAFPDDAPVTRAPAPAPKPSLPALHEPWWIVALEELRSNRRTLMLAVGALLVLVAALVFWPRGERGVSLSTIRHHPERFDNQTVRVHGEVGEVFSVGGGYAFNLQQGRDTMVVFTRSRVPVSHQDVTVVASVSTGFLDGIARQALFEIAR
jgi:hypothetical protein